MKTFKQYLIEAKKIDDVEAASMIKRDCEFFLKESGFDPSQPAHTGLFRGSDRITVKPGSLPKLSVVKNRRPLTTPPPIHRVADEYMQKQFGVPFRSQSIFVTPDSGIAEEYGRGTFLIFPIGVFKYCWSPVVEDFYYVAQRDGIDVLRTVANENPDLLAQLGLDAKAFDGDFGYVRHHKLVAAWDSLKTEKKAAIIKDWLEAGHGGYRTVGLREAIRNDPAHEIMIACDSYYALPYGAELSEEQREWTEGIMYELESII